MTQAGRTRNGLAYFEAFYTLVRAAGVDHLFVLIDQLEDLATAKNIPRSTRQREVRRFRDIFAETAGFRGSCHAIFTFHRRAAIALKDFWVAERINPPFDTKHPIGRNACVVLSGLTSTRQVERLLTTYCCPNSCRSPSGGAGQSKRIYMDWERSTPSNYGPHRNAPIWTTCTNWPRSGGWIGWIKSTRFITNGMRRRVCAGSMRTRS